MADGMVAIGQAPGSRGPAGSGGSGAGDRAAPRFFGTDGVRGRANSEPMTAETALRIAAAAALEFRRGDRRHLAVVAKDTRLSGYMLEPALAAGLTSMGMDVVLTGPLPTPAAAMLTRSMRADLGIMVSASHNPAEDNGIKLFGPDGMKLSDGSEARIEAAMESAPQWRAPPAGLGRVRRLEDAAGRYIEFAKATFPKDLRLDGLRIALDCANGAAYHVAPTVLYELGAEVMPVAVAPDGLNINLDCGATHPATIRDAVRTYRADIGIALDGDADRVILCDEAGGILDGDQILALIASDWHAAGRLRGGGLVTTVMSNLGLERHLEAQGLRLFRTPVGDRHVLEGMWERGCNLGGEQSGHIIASDHATTGDGLIAALQVLAVLRRNRWRASGIGRLFRPVPQTLRNLPWRGGAPEEAAAVRAALAAADERLGPRGRVLVRKSGTEPVLRVMVEGEDPVVLEAVLAEVCDALGRAPAALPAAAE